MSKIRSVRRHRERGIALLMVLWVLILLGLIGASFLREARVSTNLARNSVENVKAEALAEAGIRRAMLGMLDPDPATAWRADDTAYQFALGDGLVVVRIQDEGGKIDLNRAPAPLLLGLFAAVGVDPAVAGRLVDAIYDFRDPDHDRRAGGAEDADYLAAGLEGGAKDAPFDQKEELLQVMGMNREIFDAIAPYVTVHSGRSRVNIATAPGVVLRAIPNLTPEQLDRIQADKSNNARPDAIWADVVTVRAEAHTRDGGSFIREAVIKRTGDLISPFAILEWRHEWQRASEVQATIAAPQ